MMMEGRMNLASSDMHNAQPLPDGWAWTTIGESAEQVITGTTPSKKDPENYGNCLPFVKPPELNDGIVSSAADNLSSKGAELARVLPPESMLVSCIGILGKTGINTIPVAFNQQINAVIFPAEISSKYGFYYFQTSGVKEWLNSVASATTVTIVNKSKFQRMPLPLAPLPEQRRIVAEIETQFTRLDAAVAALERTRATLQRYKASVLKATCEGRLLPPEEIRAIRQSPDYEPADVLLQRILAERRARWEAHNPGKRYKEPTQPDVEELQKLPEEWCWVSLDQLSYHITSGSRGWAKYYSDQGSIFIRAQDIKTDELILENTAHVNLPESVEGTRARVFKDDLLITITGANVTKTAIVRQNLVEAYVSQHVGLVCPALSDTSQYLYYWVVSPAYGRRILERDAYGAGKPGLNLTNLRELPVALPPLIEQHRIVEEVERRLSVVAALEAAVEANLRRAERLRQAILRRAFEGRLVPQDPEDKPAAALLERIQAEKTQREAAKKSKKTDRNKQRARQLKLI